MKIIYIDVETTGLDNTTDQIIELAAIFEDTVTGKKSMFHKYQALYEGKKLPDKIFELTGISSEHLKNNGLSRKLFFAVFESWLNTLINPYDKNDKAIFAAYNAGFDVGFVRKLFIENESNFFGSYFFSASIDIMSTVAEALYFGVLRPLENYKNATVAKALNITLQNEHSAYDDILASKQIYETLIKRVMHV